MAVSEFQLALIGAGVVAVAGVWSYNSWQEYRQRKIAERIFRGDQDDVLVDDAAPEPETSAPEQVEQAGQIESMARPLTQPPTQQRTQPRTQPQRSESRVEPVFSLPQDNQTPLDEAAAADAMVSAVQTPEFIIPEAAEAVDIVVPDEALLDPMIEVAIPFPDAQPVSALQIGWDDINRADFSKRIRWVARDASTQEWTEISGTSSAADHAFVTIQLADRQGAIALDELRVFCQTANVVALANGGQNNTPALDEIIAHARAIDELCASVDIQIAIHIVSRTGQEFAGSKLRGMLEAAGLKLAADGLFYLHDGEESRLLSVCNSGAVPFDIDQMRTGSIADVTFWLDVPRVANGGHVFDTMVATARQLAEALDAMLVDDQRTPLVDGVLSSIRAKVIELQTHMSAHGIPAGGRRALRLFA